VGVEDVLDALRAHRVVGLGDIHGNERVHALRMALVRDPRFLGMVNDIVVEFGTARYQDLMDRFIRGEDVPPAALRRVWQDTTQPEYEWDLPVYEEFFRAVRKVNESLPREKKLRVLLGDPPMDWSAVRTLDDLRKQMGDRDAHAAEVIRREVLASNHGALVIYGNEHLARLEKEAGVFPIRVEMRVARTSELSRELCADPAYMAMRLGRLALLPPPPGAPFHPAERLKVDCALRDFDSEIADREPKLIEEFREVLESAARGKVTGGHAAPQLAAFLERSAPRMLAPMGRLGSITLLADTKVEGKRVRKYRSVFEGGQVVWTVGISETGEMVSIYLRML